MLPLGVVVVRALGSSFLSETFDTSGRRDAEGLLYIGCLKGERPYDARKSSACGVPRCCRGIGCGSLGVDLLAPKK